MEKSIESEFIGLLLEYPQHWHKCSEIVSEDHFKNRFLGHAFERIGVMLRKNRSVTPAMLSSYVTLPCEMEKVDYFLMLQAEIPMEGHAIHWAERIREEFDKLQFESLMKRNSNLKNVNVYESIDSLMMELASLRNTSDSGGKEIEVLVAETVDKILKRYSNEETGGFSWGIDSIDKAVGLLTPMEMVSLIAPSGVGKSSLAYQVALEVAKHARVEIFQADMGEFMSGTRLVATHTGVSAHRLKTGSMTEKEGEDIVNVNERIQGNIGFNCNSRLYIENIRNKCMAVKNEKGLGLVIIDHVKLIRTYEKTQNKFDIINEVCRQAKSIAMDLDCCVLLLNQINREMIRRNDYKPRITDAYGGEDMRENSDICLILNRPEVIIPDLDTTREFDKDRKQAALVAWEGQGYIYVAKDRSGKSGKEIRLTWDGVRTIFEPYTASVEDDDDQLELI